MAFTLAHSLKPAAHPFANAFVEAGDLEKRGLSGEISGTLNGGDHTNFMRAFREFQKPVAFLVVNAWPATDVHTKVCATYPTEGAEENKVGVLKGKFSIGSRRISTIVIVAGSPSFRCYVLARVRQVDNQFLSIGGTTAGIEGALGGQNPAGTCLKPASYSFYICSPRQLVVLFKDQGIPFLDKVISAYYTWMPMSKATILDLCEPKSFPASLLQAMSAAATAAIPESEIAVSSGIGLLAPAYSIKANMPKQIEGRLKAVAAAANVAPPSTNDVVQLFTQSGADVVEMPGPLVPILASVVCIRNDGSVDPDVKTAQLKDLNALQKDFALSTWQVELITQLRLIFSNYRATTIRFGIISYKLYGRYFEAAGGDFRKELQAIRDLEHELTNRVYTGMEAKIKDSHQIKHISRCCYVGLLYYQRTLVSQADKDNFAKYAVDSVKSHITPVNDIDLCINIVHILPEKNVVAAVMLGEHLSFNDMDTVLANYSQEDQTIIYKNLVEKDNPGPWATAKKIQIEETAYREYLDAALAKLASKEQERERDFEASIRYERDDARREEARAAFIQWKDEILVLRRKIVRLDDLVPTASSPATEGPRSKALKIVRDLFYKVHGAQQEPPEEAQEEAKGPNEEEDHGSGDDE